MAKPNFPLEMFVFAVSEVCQINLFQNCLGCGRVDFVKDLCAGARIRLSPFDGCERVNQLEMFT